MIRCHEVLFDNLRWFHRVVFESLHIPFNDVHFILAVVTMLYTAYLDANVGVLLTLTEVFLFLVIASFAFRS